MTKYFRVVFEEYDSQPTADNKNNVVLEGKIAAPTNCLDFGVLSQSQMKAKRGWTWGAVMQLTHKTVQK